MRPQLLRTLQSLAYTESTTIPGFRPPVIENGVAPHTVFDQSIGANNDN